MIYEDLIMQNRKKMRKLRSDIWTRCIQTMLRISIHTRRSQMHMTKNVLNL